MMNRKTLIAAGLILLFFTPMALSAWAIVIQNAADYLSAGTIVATTTMSTPQLTLDGVSRTTWPVGTGDFDQNLNTTDDVSFNSLTTPSISLGGDTRTEWPAGGSYQSANKTGYDWYVWKTGSDYYFLGDNATLLIDTDFDARFNAIMVDCSYKASFYLEEATYSYDTDLLLEGTGALFSRMPIIRGAGIGRTIMSPAAGINGFVLKKGISAQIYDLSINMASTGAAAYGIYGDPTGGSTAYLECGGFHSEFDNIRIYGGVAGGAGFYMVNSEWCKFEDIRIDMNSGCHGMIFINLATADYAYCSAQFHGNIIITLQGSNTVALMFKGASDTKACNLMGGQAYFWLRRNTGGSYSNVTALYIRYTHYFDLGNFHMEYVSTFVDIDHSYGGVIRGGRHYCIPNSVDSTTMFKIGSNAINLLFESWHIAIGGLTIEWVNDPNNSSTMYNAYRDIVLHAGGGVFTQTVQANTSLELIRRLGYGTWP